MNVPFTTAMLQGKCCQFTLTLTATGFEVSTVAVTEWGQVQNASSGSLAPKLPVVGTIDLKTVANGVYAVAQNGKGVAAGDVDESCVAVALITDNQKIMIATADATDGANSTLYWGYNLTGKDVGGITETTDEAVAKADFAGAAHTAVIIKAYTEHSVEMNTRDIYKLLQDFNADHIYKDWYVPTLGQVSEMRTNVDAINKMLIAISGTKMRMSQFYWSSSEYNSDHSWYVFFTEFSVKYGSKGSTSAGH